MKTVYLTRKELLARLLAHRAESYRGTLHLKLYRVEGLEKFHDRSRWVTSETSRYGHCGIKRFAMESCFMWRGSFPRLKDPLAKMLAYDCGRWIHAKCEYRVMRGKKVVAVYRMRRKR